MNGNTKTLERVFLRWVFNQTKTFKLNLTQVLKKIVEVTIALLLSKVLKRFHLIDILAFLLLSVKI